LAAARRLPLLLGMHATNEDKRRLLEAYRDHGRPSLTHASTAVAYVADTMAEAQAALRAAMPGWLATTAQYTRIDAAAGPARDPHVYLEHLLNIHPVGPPALCVQRLIQTMATTGVRRLLLMVEGAGDRKRTEANIARLGAEVIPQLRAWSLDRFHANYCI
jgi:hypothetical protein